MLGAKLCSSKRCVEILTPIPVNVTLFGNVSTDVIKLKWGHTGVGWALLQSLVSSSEGNLDTKTQWHTGRTPRDDRGVSWSHVSTRQGTPRIAGNHQKLDTLIPDVEPPEFWQQISVVSSHSVCGNLLVSRRK